MKRFWFLLLLTLLTLSACAEPTPVAQVTETAVPSKTATVTLTPEPTATPTPKSTATMWPTRTKMIISTLTSVVVPEWAKYPDNELYLCIAPDENEVKRLAVINPVTQEIFYLPIREKEIQGYFWLAPPASGIGWIWHGQYRGYNEYAILDFSTGSVEYYEMPEETREFLESSLTGWERGEPILEYPSQPLPLLKINSAAGEFYLLRQDVTYIGKPPFQYFSQDKRYVFFTMFSKENNGSGQKYYLQGYDLVNQEDIVFEILDSSNQSSPDFPIENSGILIIGSRLINMDEEAIVYQLPQNIREGIYNDEAWDLNNGRFIFKRTNSPQEGNEESSIFIYNIKNQTLQELDSITNYFLYNDMFSLKEEIFYNLIYMSELDSLGFSYFGQDSTGQYQYWGGAGGYCLYSLQNDEINCLTDHIKDIHIERDQSTTFAVREEVVYAQWANSKKFIAFFMRVGCPYCDSVDPGRLMIYNLDTDDFFYIDNYSVEPLGVWRP